MTRRSTILVLLVLPAAAGAASTPAAAQWTAWAEPSRPAWLGVSYDVHWVAREGGCQPRVVVETVVSGAPADRAGLRPGDAIVALNGESVGSLRLELLSSRLSSGDSVRLRLARGGEVREVVAVADRRPPRPPTGLTVRRDGGFSASDAPIVRLVGDTLVARNLDMAKSGRARGYWVAHDDGRADYRRLGRFSGDPMDRRVADLMACAASTQAMAPASPAIRVDRRSVQARADSLRVVMAQRALTRQAPEGSVRIHRLRRAETAPLPPGVRELPAEPGVSVFSYHVGDHLVAGERGVAGAEITALEPELAEYFRGARQGLLVLRVAPGSPAERAGLRPGDVITSGGGRSLDTVGELRLLLALPDPNPIELRVVRQGRARTLTIRRD